MGIRTRKRYKRIKNFVLIRDGFVCCYCNKELDIKSVTFDHIVPDSKRGTFNSTNLTVACLHCNNKRGSLPFFEYCKQFEFSESKIIKYKKLYFNNLKIKVLNIAKEDCLSANEAIPISLINQACSILKINLIDFSNYEINIQINFDQLYASKIIKFNFEKLIKIIECDSY